MGIIEILSLGLTQGLTEFIPVSSSGHLVILQTLFSGGSDHLFLEYINIGTTLALFVYFRKKIIEILKDIFVCRDMRLAINILITSVPAGAIGFGLSGFITDSAFFGSVITVVVALFVVGTLMVVLERLPKQPAVLELRQLSKKKALLVGIAQVFALIPGVSRSGATIITGRLVGFNRSMAAEYSFLASIPIMAAVSLKVLLMSSHEISQQLVPVLLGNIIAFLAGIFAIKFLISYLNNKTLAVFGWYRIGLAGLVSILLVIQYIQK